MTTPDPPSPQRLVFHVASVGLALQPRAQCVRRNESRQPYGQVTSISNGLVTICIPADVSMPVAVPVML